MDILQPILQPLVEAVVKMIRPDVLVQLSLQPIALQWLKTFASYCQIFKVPAAPLAWVTGPGMMWFNLALAAYAGLHVGLSEHLAWYVTAMQVGLAWLYAEVVYHQVVKPLAASPSPTVPANPGSGT